MRLAFGPARRARDAVRRQRGPQADPRAATTHPATLELLADDGLADDMARVGLVAPVFQFWDRPSGELVAQFDHALLKDDTRFPYVVQCEQFKTARLLLARLRELPNVAVNYGHAVVSVAQSDDAVSVRVRDAGGESEHKGAWLIGADGGRSTVRKECGIEFEGFTWPERFIVLTTPYDFEARRGFSYRSYFADVGRLVQLLQGLGRRPARAVAHGLSGRSGRKRRCGDERHRRAGAHAGLFPGLATLRDRPPQSLRHASAGGGAFRQGRVLLAGDAAHVNNPIGGMGLNGGIQDAANLSEKLVQVLVEGADARLLDLYDRQRRAVAVEFVQQQSIANKKRLEAREPQARKRNLDELRAIAADPEKARDFLLRTSMIASQRRAAAMTLEEV